MPTDGKRWRHVVIGTWNSWLPGDPRGFRAAEHKIHSSGDYKNPPPKDEHAGLFRYSKKFSGDAIIIPAEQRAIAARKIIAKLKKLNHQVLAVSVSGMHAHILVELPDDVSEIRRVIGHCKTVASHALRDAIPGRVWARYGSFRPIKDKQHHVNTFNYILNQKDAWVWSYKVEESEEAAEEATDE